MLKGRLLWCLMFMLLAMWPVGAWAQSFNSSISGTVTDPSGAVVPGVDITITSLETKATSRTVTGPDGLFSFPDLPTGAYELKASLKGFKEYVQRGIELTINTRARLDIRLELGTEAQTVEVVADVSQLNFDDPTIKQGVRPEVIEDLPLLVGGAIRSSASFVVLMPGVNPGSNQNPYSTRINGGLTSGDEAVLDGVSMTQGINGNTGMISAYADYPWSPEAISEVSVLTSSYDPQYGATTSGVIMAEIKNGTSQYHGSVYEFLRNTALNARQYGIPDRPKDIENDFGGNIGGPIKIPWLFDTARKKSFFFVNMEGFTLRGGATTPTLSIPSMKERQGDFSDWTDENGSLIPVYDPATTRPNPNYNPALPPGANNLQFLRDQFMGCDGNTPNVICASDPRLQNSLAQGWFKYLPTPTFSGAQYNYVVPEPIPDTVFADSKLVNVRGDMYWRDIDHFYVSVNYRGSKPASVTELPPQLATEEPYYTNYSFVNRFNWSHTFSPKLLNHFAIGYLDTYVITNSADKPYVDDLPKIPGASSYEYPSIIGFDDFNWFGQNVGTPHETRPVWIANDLVTWVKGKHTLKFGGEIRKHDVNGERVTNQSGTVYFSRLGTGLNEITSGNALASFLLGQVDNANYDIQTLTSTYPRFSGYNFHAGDTWKVTPKLTLSYGIRWDLFTPTYEKYNNFSFLDPNRPNPEAGNLPGTLAFAGDQWGDASYGARYPEQLFKTGFAPRLGIAYSLSEKTVVRAGYGIFYSAPIYPGWGGGMSQQGFNANINFSSSNYGYTPAFILANGFPAISPSQQPPFITSTFANGNSMGIYRPLDANRLPYAQQWNLTIEHQLTPSIAVTAAYVGNKGTRLPSRDAALNALNPSLLSMGPALEDTFEPGQTELNGVSIPYDGWVEQMTGCTPTVAQALLPYPQYCDSLQGNNENAGNSTYHSFQLKVEKRMTGGFYFLGAYTISKLLTDSEGVQIDAATWNGGLGVMSPFQRQRNKRLAINDVPQVFSLALVYDLPVGKGQRFLNQGGVVNGILGGWQISTIFRATGGVPQYFRSYNCNVPGEFRAQCVPAILEGANPYAQDKSNFDPNKPLYNRDAFEDPDGFNYYLGVGPAATDLRGFNYYNNDIALVKNTRITERFTFQFRAEFFNMWNWHMFTSPGGEDGMGQQFQVTNVDISNPSFGMWDGTVSTPRNIQFGLKLLF